jgi:hypothetical protein
MAANGDLNLVASLVDRLATRVPMPPRQNLQLLTELNSSPIGLDLAFETYAVTTWLVLQEQH